MSASGFGPIALKPTAEGVGVHLGTASVRLGRLEKEHGVRRKALTNSSPTS